jgi:hypothetical protein
MLFSWWNVIFDGETLATTPGLDEWGEVAHLFHRLPGVSTAPPTGQAGR